MSAAWYSVAILFLALCLKNHQCQDAPEKESRKSNQVELNFKDQETPSEQLFLNRGMKKRWKDTKLKLENSIFKSRIEVLGEIFRARVEELKRDTKVALKQV